MASSKKSKQQQQDGNQNKLNTNTNTNTNNKTTTVTTTTSSTTNDKSISKNGSVEEADEIIVLHEDSSSCGSREIQQRDDILIEDNNCVLFSMAKVQRIIQTQGIGTHNHVVFLFNKASEMFLQKFIKDAYTCSVQDRKRALHYDHLSSVVAEQKRYGFLSEFVPEKVNAEDALAEWKSA